MSIAWFFRFVDRTHFLVPPAIFIALAGGVYAVALAGPGDGFVHAELASRQILGTVALFVLLPAYLIGLMPIMRRVTRTRLAELGDLCDASAREAIEAGMLRVHSLVWPGMLVGLAYGISQNPIFVAKMWRSGPTELLDVAFVVGACWLWVVVAFVLAWRLPTSRAISRLGDGLPVDLYRLDRLAPLARIATADILVVVGAMAFSPLQGLDAEFRLGNYVPTILVGLPAAAVLFLTPLWGVRNNVQRHKQARIDELKQRIDAVDRSDVTALEPLTAHLDRVESLSTWPVDVEILTRVLAYGVIPPLAWVAAALVENFIDRIAG